MFNAMCPSDLAAPSSYAYWEGALCSGTEAQTAGATLTGHVKWAGNLVLSMGLGQEYGTPPPEIVQHGGKSEYHGQSYGFITFLDGNHGILRSFIALGHEPIMGMFKIIDMLFGSIWIIYSD